VVEDQIETRIAAMVAAQKSSYEERTLMALRAANEGENAEDFESRAAGVREVQEAIWNEGGGEKRPPIGGTPLAPLDEDETKFAGYLVTCGKCEAPFANLKAYWSHLDEHDMTTLGSGKYTN
jgi:hypothetical protein